MIHNIINYLNDNKEWLFSGIGLLLITSLFGILKIYFTRNKQETISAENHINTKNSFYLPQSLENKIINYLNKNDSATIKELSEFLNLSRQDTVIVIDNLNEKGVLENIGTEQRTRWALKKDLISI